MMRGKQWWKIGAAVLTVMVLLFTENYKELRDTQEISGISVDVGDGGKFDFGLELAVTDKENNFTIGSELLEISADDLPDALKKAELANEFQPVLSHGSLLIISERVAATKLDKISEFLLKNWTGQKKEVYIAVADGSTAKNILKNSASEDLRSTQLSGQVRLAIQNGQLDCPDAFEFADRYRAGQETTLPLITAIESGYRISGTYQCKGMTA